MFLDIVLKKIKWKSLKNFLPKKRILSSKLFNLTKVFPRILFLTVFHFISLAFGRPVNAIAWQIIFGRMFIVFHTKHCAFIKMFAT